MPLESPNTDQSPPRLHQIQDLADSRRLGVGRSTLFALVESGELRSVKVGRRRLVPESAIVDFIEHLERISAQPVQ